MSIRLCATILVLLASFTARAAFVVDDPKHVLTDMARWQHAQPFETAMACGQNAVIDAATVSCSLKCNDRWCESRCETAHDKSLSFGLHVDECSSGLAHIFGDNGLIIDVPKAEYLAGGSTYVLSFLKNIGLFIQPEGAIALTSFFPSHATLIDNGQMKTIGAALIRGEISYTGQSQTQSFDLMVTDQLDGIRQILMFSMNQDVFFRVHGLVSTPWAPTPFEGLNP